MATIGDGVDERIGAVVATKRPATILTDMATDGDGVDEEIAWIAARKRPATTSTGMANDGEVVDQEMAISGSTTSTGTETDGDVVDEETGSSGARKLPVRISTDMETDGDVVDVERGMSDSTISTDRETDGDDVDGDDVDEETHLFACFCERKWSLEEPAPIQEEPLEERLTRLLDRSVQPLSIKKHARVDLEKLLFTPERDYLMNLNGQKVQKDDLLNNKYILLYIFSLVENYKMGVMTRELIELRDLLRDKGCFEIVFVGLRSDVDLSKQKEYFEDYVSKMTWPFIPYEDHDARQLVRSTFGFSESRVIFPYCGIIDPTGLILQSWAWDILNYYGHDAFPFTDERIISLYKEEASMFTEGVSLKALLGSPNRDYVLSPNGDEVLIQDLENKVVCILLDDPRSSVKDVVKETFKDVELKHPDFVFVYVCRHFTSTLCEREYIDFDSKAKLAYHSVDWHRIPYKDSAARKIWRVILHHCMGGLCNVVGPQGMYVETFAFGFMKHYGIEAYPFTVQKSAELEARNVKRKISLEVILQPGFPIIHSGELISEDEASALYHKRLLVLFGTHSCCELGQFLGKLKSLYHLKKGTDEEFEVIYISLDCLWSDYDQSTSKMPWSVFPFGWKEVAGMLEFNELVWYWPDNIPFITAFKNGQLVGVEGDLHLKKDERVDFPYINSVEDEFFKKMQSGTIFPKDWDFWREF